MIQSASYGSATGTLSQEDILNDYRLGWLSRHASLIGRREVLTGKAKFGIFGDGKEVAQLAMARACRPGDIRSGYYRDQTFMFATGMSNVLEFFAQLYADIDLSHDPASGGRQMNAHFATRMLNADGSWRDLTTAPHSAADSSPTASQMPRMVGLAYASKLYRQQPQLPAEGFSRRGNEIVFGTIGDASTSEGIFWETINAAGVLQIPLLMSVWDDNYGISVPIQYQTTKGSISKLLSGFHSEGSLRGVDIYTVKGWDYEALVEVYRRVADKVRGEHTPAVVHVQEVTQPQGHSTSGSHERYKSKERLEWEREYDCLNQMRKWILRNGLSTEAELDDIEKWAKTEAANLKAQAWANYMGPIKAELEQAAAHLDRLAMQSPKGQQIREIRDELMRIAEPFRRDIYVAMRKAMILTAGEPWPERREIIDWKHRYDALNTQRFNSHLHSQSARSALHVPHIPARYRPGAEAVDGRQVLQACFDHALGRDPRVLAFGEDVGFLGDVNQAFAGLQKKYGELRVTDTGIREATIIGQGIGLAMRGLRPIAEIQYLDYLLYAIQILSDDLATLHYRTAGGQKAPLIIRTRGHRLEGIWHSGSPMGMILHSLRGIYVLVPRNMTQAAGFYNTMLQSDDPALIIEVLNGYRLKEQLPENIGEFTVPLGVPEVLREGHDLTVVTYGACCRLAEEAADALEALDISVELIDVQSLLPFDRHHRIVESLKKTNKVLFLDEDVPGGASAYLMQQVLEVQNGWRWLDAAPRTLTAKAHRPAYASDGDYFSKPNVEDIIETINRMLHEYQPQRYPLIYGA
jgi:pyruvate/2-oxoglutarate/acetoin dehydrogenase E1 component/TPP-dependent pyruvate/acetoin dehydrogenase alpha subunit